jgi:hypothetical protein
VATYLPTANLSPLFTFVTYSSTVGALETALQAAFASQNVQVYADDTNSGNALVVPNASAAISVPSGWSIGYNQGFWMKYPPASMAGGVNSVFTAYP